MALGLKLVLEGDESRPQEPVAYQENLKKIRRLETWPDMSKKGGIFVLSFLSFSFQLRSDGQGFLKLVGFPLRVQLCSGAMGRGRVTGIGGLESTAAVMPIPLSASVAIMDALPGWYMLALLLCQYGIWVYGLINARYPHLIITSAPSLSAPG